MLPAGNVDVEPYGEAGAADGGIVPYPSMSGTVEGWVPNAAAPEFSVPTAAAPYGI
jgi:hypothetical protein